MIHSKTKTSFYRRLYVAYLIDTGIDSVPKIIEATAMPRRTAQDTITALHELDIACEFVGAKKDGHYRVSDWGAINKAWVSENIDTLKAVLEYP